MMVDTRSSFQLPDHDEAVARHLSHELGISRITATLLAQRGITQVDQARLFLTPDLDRDWLDPLIIPGMAAAADAVEAQLRAGGDIVIYGDFDVDGISATAVMTKGLSALGAPFGVSIRSMIPRRLDEGYGFTQASLERLEAMEPGMVLTVDNGISAQREVQELLSRGVKVVVTDHHEPGDLVPQGVPVADPKLDPDCPSSILAGVGVALKLIQVLGQRLGQPELWKTYTDIATLGTVADQMLLMGENRALVAHGVARMNDDPSPAIAAFKTAFPKSVPLSADGLSYNLLPRINSAGRVGDSNVALDLLLAPDIETATRCIQDLETLNVERRRLEAEFTDAAIALAKDCYHDERALVLGAHGWHEGVKGIVAARLAGMYQVPTVLFSYIDDVAHGSGRSFGQVNLFKALEPCAHLFTRYGGHEAAVGITMPVANIDAFRSLLCQQMELLPSEQFVPETQVD
ncbi:MAG: DHH family phosphoesterase, partial [Coriobacteriales bacterium]|nr:DHH family phosphoesterase [Coriobacteriales bacterium]